MTVHQANFNKFLGAKARVHIAAFAARLKSRPFKTSTYNIDTRPPATLSKIPLIAIKPR
jgi:hypothetical protein